MESQCYDPDLTDQHVGPVEPLLPRLEQTGQSGAGMGAVPYLVRTGCR
jgi:hypothetical protein